MRDIRPTRQWADEVPGHEPLMELEEFYLYVAFVLGNPQPLYRKAVDVNGRATLTGFASKFYQLAREKLGDELYVKQGGAALMLQYLIWYDRQQK